MAETTAPPPGWAVAPALGEYVASLVAYDVDLGGPGVHVGMPATTLTFVLPLDEPLDVGWWGDPTSRGARWSCVSGLHAQPAEIHHQGRQRGIQLALTAAGSRALLGMPAAALAGELVELDAVHPALRHLPEQLADSPSWAGRLRAVEDALLAALAATGAPRPRAAVGRALAALTSGAPVSLVAEEVGCSSRHLSTLVRGECGLSPKEYQLVARFDGARALLVRAARQGRPSLAEVASLAGYADQAHLSREWRRLAGCTPSQWLREEFPFLQDSAGLLGAE